LKNNVINNNSNLDYREKKENNNKFSPLRKSIKFKKESAANIFSQQKPVSNDFNQNNLNHKNSIQMLLNYEESIQNKELEIPSDRRLIHKKISNSKILYEKKISLSANKVESVKNFKLHEKANFEINNKKRQSIIKNNINRNSIKNLYSDKIENFPAKISNNVKDSQRKNSQKFLNNKINQFQKFSNYSSLIKNKYNLSPNSQCSNNGKSEGSNFNLDLNTNLSINSNFSQNKYSSKNKTIITDNNTFENSSLKNRNYYQFKTPHSKKLVNDLNDYSKKTNIFLNNPFINKSKIPNYLNNSMAFNEKIINKDIIHNDYNLKNRKKSLGEKPESQLKSNIQNMRNEIEFQVFNKFSFNEFYNKRNNDENNLSKDNDEILLNCESNFDCLNIKTSIPECRIIADKNFNKFSQFSHKKPIKSTEGKDFTLKNDSFNFKANIIGTRKSMKNINNFESINNKKINKFL